MILYLVRHAWAGHFGDPHWPDDRQRPLSDEGRMRFAKVVKRLAERGVAPEVIATSPLVRCRQTAEILAEGVAGSPPVVACEALEPGSDLAGMVCWTAQQAGDCREVAWVGHAPDVGLLATALMGGNGAIRFAKGAIAAIELDGPPEPGTGALRWLVTAKILGC